MRENRKWKMENVRKYKIIFLVLIVLAILFFLIKSDKPNFDSLPEASVAESVSDRISSMKQGEGYSSPFGDFDFVLPHSFTISRIEEAGGETLLFRGEDERRSFQIHITDFDDPSPLSPEKIRADLPSMDFRDPQVISVDEVQAVVFLTTEGSLETREIWMVRGGMLYQISTYAEFDNDMVEILSKWSWNQ